MDSAKIPNNQKNLEIRDHDVPIPMINLQSMN